MPTEFTPRRGTRSKLNTIPVADGQLLFGVNTSDTSDGTNGNYKTVGVYLDIDNGGLERYQVASEKLVKVREISGGDIQTTFLDFDQVNNKVDRAIPNDTTDENYTMEGNVAVLTANGGIKDTGKKIEDVGSGSGSIFAEVVLEQGQWNTMTRSQQVPVPNILKDSIVIVSPKFPNESMRFNIYCSAQDNGTLTFTYLERQPTQDIAFNIVIEEKFKPEDERDRYVVEGYLNPNDWIGNKQKVYPKTQSSKFSISSVVTVTPMDIIKAMPYNIYASGQGNDYIEFTCGTKPDEMLGYYFLVDNYN